MIRKRMARIRRALHKNADEIVACLSGQMPRFAVGRSERLDELPVFVFHDVDPAGFESQLLHLVRNGYRTLDADEVAEALRTRRSVEREVALTFDDGTSNFRTVAFPLLERYGFRAILFLIPGLVPETPGPLCTWGELRQLHASGLVDVQSHSMTHARVAVSARIVGFLHEGFGVEAYGNVSVPLSSSDDPRRPARELRPGSPVFENVSRLAGRPRFVEDPAIGAALLGHVREHGAGCFFHEPGWRGALERVARRFPYDRRGAFETAEETEQAISWELCESKAAIERALGQPVRHFCYPWFEGSRLADRLARDAGYASVHYGARLTRAGNPGAPTRVRRISEEYLCRLPGLGRASLATVWRKRLRGVST